MLSNLKFLRRQAYKILRRSKIFQSYDADGAYVPVLKRQPVLKRGDTEDQRDCHGFNVRPPCAKGAVSGADWGIAVLITSNFSLAPSS